MPTLTIESPTETTEIRCLSLAEEPAVSHVQTARGRPVGAVWTSTHRWLLEVDPDDRAELARWFGTHPRLTVDGIELRKTSIAPDRRHPGRVVVQGWPVQEP